MPLPPTVGDCAPTTTILNLRVPTVEFLPRSLRLPYIELYYHLLNNYNTARSEALNLHTLARIFATPNLVLRKNGRGDPRKSNSLSLGRLIKRRISMAMAGEGNTLLDEARVAHLRSNSAQSQSDSPQQKARKAFLAGE
ncbi:hypothetical protein BWQ96_04004 [Gracilariopsis chorda]|uniref:Uncharacterized protein n=1 Tax=Gracilariopsis chorda TaxID=448386 RepID=A0A2V3IVV3_9FLOR|nr:hypothetical protein BWQ96_04004 [Gracilariopsis chorda]|eukprot:PXF46219.1 hypothetical protein BWQ96_04004 [Gracilariopsis chorda]